MGRNYYFLNASLMPGTVLGILFTDYSTEEGKIREINAMESKLKKNIDAKGWREAKINQNT